MQELILFVAVSAISYAAMLAVRGIIEREAITEYTSQQRRYVEELRHEV